MTGTLGVGIDVRSFVPGSGQARHMWRLGVWLAGRGHRVEMLSVRPQPHADAPAGMRLHRLHSLRNQELRAYVAGLELDALVINPERSRRYRGIRANVLRPGYGTDQYRQKLRSFRAPAVRHVRWSLRLSPWVLVERHWERRFYEAADPAPEIIANSAYMRREILDSYDVPADHVHVIHNGVDLTEFSPSERDRLRPAVRERWGIPADAACLLFMGHNFRLKGLWEMIALLPDLRARSGAPDLRVLVAGSGVGKGQLRKARRLMARHGVEEAVHLLGPVHPAIHAFAAADVLVHLSWHDSFGFVVLEAMACGLPVLTTRFAGASEVIENGESGLLVHPGSRPDISDAVALLMDRDLRQRMSSAAADRAAGYPEERTFAAILEVLRTARSRGCGPVR